MWIACTTILSVIAKLGDTQVVSSTILPRGWEQQCKDSLVVVRNAVSEAKCLEMCKLESDCCCAGQ